MVIVGVGLWVFKFCVRESWVVDVDYVQWRLGVENFLLVDFRMFECYWGEDELIDFVAGYILGVINFFYIDLVDLEGMWFILDELEECF